MFETTLHCPNTRDFLIGPSKIQRDKNDCQLYCEERDKMIKRTESNSFSCQKQGEIQEPVGAKKNQNYISAFVLL